MKQQVRIRDLMTHFGQSLFMPNKFYWLVRNIVTRKVYTGITDSAKEAQTKIKEKMLSLI